MIQKVFAREIIDSRGRPTLEAEITTETGVYRAAAPSGASTGQKEAVELRDGDKSRFFGKGVLKAVENVNTKISDSLTGQVDVANQNEVDAIMKNLDGADDLANLGANAIIAISMAAVRASAGLHNIQLFHEVSRLAGTQEFQLPIPCFNVINGGAHAGNVLAFQEFMIVPIGMNSFHEALRCGCEIYATLKCVIEKHFGAQALGVGDEGGFAPPVHNAFQCCDLLIEAIQAAGYDTETVKIAIDSAASQFYRADTKKYDMDFKLAASFRTAKELEELKQEPNMPNASELFAVYMDLLHRYPMIILLEDPFDEESWDDFAKLTSAVGDRVHIVGDDLLVTHVERIEEAVSKSACNTLLLKQNQAGTISDTIAAAKKAKEHGWQIMASHRSGDTADPFIADLAVGLSCKYIKSGAPCRSERLAKYNQLLRIEEYLDSIICKCGSVECQCGAHCTCDTKVGHAEFNYGKRYMMRCG